MKWLSLIIFILFCLNSQAQKHDNIWMAGRGHNPNKGTILDFTNSSLTLDTTLQRNLPMFRSCASICDSSGNLLFYTNGIQINNAQHQLMINGDSLNPGQAANDNRDYGYVIPEGTIIIPHPTQINKYYLFHQSYTSSAAQSNFAENLYFSLIDMDGDNGLGVIEKKNQLLTSDSLCLGQLEAIKHGNGRDWWLIQPLTNSNGYLRFLVVGDSILQYPKQHVGFSLPFDGYELTGQATFSPNGEKYIRYDYKNDLDIFDFDRCSGLLSNYLHVPITDSVDNLSAWFLFAGVAVSPNSQYLYVSSHNYIYQFDLLASNISLSKDTVATYDGFKDNILPTMFSYAQLAPDDKIYIHSYTSRYLHTINNPDIGGNSCNVQQHSVYIHHYNGQFIPNFPHYRTPPFIGSACDTLIQIYTLKEKLEIKIYPNPASHEISIEIIRKNLNQKYEIEILDLAGKVLLRRKTKFGILNLNIEHLTNGIYICKIIGENEILIQKLIVQKR